MRFFTMDWWSGDDPEDRPDSAFADYAVHLAAIRDHLPADLRATQESVSLHDCRLRVLTLNAAQQSLVLTLESHDADERLTLIYCGVERFESYADPDVGLGGPAGYGDLGYSEVEMPTPSSFEHHLLFSTGVELVVTFRDFALQRVRV